MERIEKLKEFLNASPTDSFLRHALALEYIKEGREEDAMRLFGQLLQDNPGYVGSYYQLAKLLEKHGRTEEAISCYEKGMEMARTSGDQHSYNELRSAWEELIF